MSLSLYLDYKLFCNIENLLVKIIKYLMIEDCSEISQ